MNEKKNGTSEGSLEVIEGEEEEPAQEIEKKQSWLM